MKKVNIKEEFQKFLFSEVAAGNLDVAEVTVLLDFVSDIVEQRDDAIIKELVYQVETWEASTEGDGGLFSLGLRRCIDILRGKDYAPLDETDYRPKE